ncbi:MAG TPA: hypothetical protein VMD59_05290, partial [Acidimicrobiales bacterium]|nr:hypothetical protein [Acidimicrobiales bacterium]
MTGTVGTASEWSQRLVESLVTQGVIDAGAGRQALDQSAISGTPVAVVLARAGIVHPTTSVQYLASLSGMPAVDLATDPPVFSAASLVPSAVARRYGILGCRVDHGRLVLACAEPLAQGQLNDVVTSTGLDIGGLVLADPGIIEHYLDELESSSSVVDYEGSAGEPSPSQGSTLGAPIDESPHGIDLEVDELGLDIENLLSYDGGGPRSLPPGFLPMPHAPSSFLAGFGRELASLEIDDLLTYAVQIGASDLHLADRLPPALRVNGSIRRIDGLPPLTNDQLRHMLYNILPQAARERFEASKELDTSHAIHSVGRFRVNVFQQRGSIGAVLRMIPHQIPAFDTLGMPP